MKNQRKLLCVATSALFGFGCAMASSNGSSEFGQMRLETQHHEILFTDTVCENYLAQAQHTPLGAIAEKIAEFEEAIEDQLQQPMIITMSIDIINSFFTQSLQNEAREKIKSNNMIEFYLYEKDRACKLNNDLVKDYRQISDSMTKLLKISYLFIDKNSSTKIHADIQLNEVPTEEGMNQYNKSTLQDFKNLYAKIQ